MERMTIEFVLESDGDNKFFRITDIITGNYDIVIFINLLMSILDDSIDRVDEYKGIKDKLSRKQNKKLEAISSFIKYYNLEFK